MSRRWPPPDPSGHRGGHPGRAARSRSGRGDAHDQDELTGRWAVLPVARDPLLDAVDLHADRTSFTGVDLHRIVEPGEIRVAAPGTRAGTRDASNSDASQLTQRRRRAP
jgi:hypothetical protein